MTTSSGSRNVNVRLTVPLRPRMIPRHIVVLCPCPRVVDLVSPVHDGVSIAARKRLAAPQGGGIVVLAGRYGRGRCEEPFELLALSLIAAILS